MRTMKNLFKYFIATFLPWMVLFFYDNPGGAIIAMIMQVSIIGWIPASMWAFRVIKSSEVKIAKENTKAND